MKYKMGDRVMVWGEVVVVTMIHGTMVRVCWPNGAHGWVFAHIVRT